MGFLRDFIDKKRSEWEEKKRVHRERLEELRRERTKTIELLDKFTITQLNEFCTDMVGKTPEHEIKEAEALASENDKVKLNRIKKGLHEIGRQRTETVDRKTYYQFIEKCLEEEQIKLSQIKDFAIREKIVAPSYFDDESKEKVAFGRLINSVSNDFRPEPIRGEKDFQAQLVVFLKGKFPEMKVEREKETKRGNDLDILVEGKYVFELKVPKVRDNLRALSAQIEEYLEEYPNLCVVIADISETRGISENEEIDPNLRQNIKEYADKYKMKYDVRTLVFPVKQIK